ncbi:MAG: hypothetical protein NXI20_16920 [bacterium]|nr:hypothetical protein [bacterium]
MKPLLTLLIVLLSFQAFSQNNVALVSVWGDRIGAEEGEPTTNLFNHIDNEDLHNKAIQGKVDEVIAELGKVFDVMPGDHLGESYYKYLLDDLEFAGENVQYFPLGINADLETEKQDYRLSEHHVVFYDSYLAIGTFKPFDNKESVKYLFEKMPDAKAFMFINFSPSAGFVGSEYGVGKSSAKVTLRVKLVDRNMKSIFKMNVSGKDPNQFEVKMKEFDSDSITKSYEAAIDALIANIQSKFSKKASKIKW